MVNSQPARTSARRTLSTILSGRVATGSTRPTALPYRLLASSSPWAARRLLGEARGAVPTGVTVFDDGCPAVVNLDPELLAALRTAGRDAATDGVEFFVNSGWRAPDYQEQLLHDAIGKYGSAAEAARWVASPETSAHVRGLAVDIGRAAARAWLSEHGARYGLCQIYANEPWHYELRPDAVEHGRPPMYPDPSHDPRNRR